MNVNQLAVFQLHGKTAQVKTTIHQFHQLVVEPPRLFLIKPVPRSVSSLQEAVIIA